jgi:CheY-like chemotaxis protein
MEKVLVVDDETDILKLISENLVVRGYQVSQAQTGSEALGKLYSDQLSLLVLDIKLPDISGWELVDRIDRDPEIPKDFPILIMTASIADANIDLSNYPNVVEILIKPFNVVTLVSAVKRSIGRK